MAGRGRGTRRIFPGLPFVWRPGILGKIGWPCRNRFGPARRGPRVAVPKGRIETATTPPLKFLRKERSWLNGLEAQAHIVRRPTALGVAKLGPQGFLDFLQKGGTVLGF